MLWYWLGQAYFCQKHWKAVKMILKHLSGTRNKRLRLGGRNIFIIGYTNCNYASYYELSWTIIPSILSDSFWPLVGDWYIVWKAKTVNPTRVLGATKVRFWAVCVLFLVLCYFFYCRKNNYSAVYSSPSNRNIYTTSVVLPFKHTCLGKFLLNFLGPSQMISYVWTFNCIWSFNGSPCSPLLQNQNLNLQNEHKTFLDYY